MNTRWPRGRYNGRKIAGLECRIRINVLWWSLKIKWFYGTLSLHFGPLHVWIEPEYD
jgi:hypothetical protein